MASAHAQGDVLLVRVNGDSTPNAVAVARDARRGVVLAECAAIGHAPAVSDDAAAPRAVMDARLPSPREIVPVRD
jgi:hypothetical protein